MRTDLRKIIITTGKTIIFAMIVFALFSPQAIADSTSQNINDTLTIKSGDKTVTEILTDNNYQSYWSTSDTLNEYLHIESTQPIAHIYVCYFFKPSELIIQTSDDAVTWLEAKNENDSDYYHISYSFGGPSKFIRIKAANTSTGKLGISEIKAYSEGQLPDNIQTWNPTYDNPDMMIFSAHPDDEAVFFAGLIPYYGAQMDKKITMVYMTHSAPYRRSESLNYLWSMKQDALPLFAGFPDVYEMESYSKTRSVWGRTETLNYMVSLIRQKKPDVIVSHDINGEYGHGAHMFTALCVAEAVRLAKDFTYHPESYEKYGTHETKKLYLHLYDKNKITLDVLDEPLSEFNGLSSLDLARMNIGYYASQLIFNVVRVHGKESKYSCYDYGLVYSSVGEDENGNDMFENIVPRTTPTAQPTTTPSPAPHITATPVHEPSVSPTFSTEPSSVSPGPKYTLILCILAGIIFIACILIIVLIIRKK